MSIKTPNTLKTFCSTTKIKFLMIALLRKCFSKKRPGEQPIIFTNLSQTFEQQIVAALDAHMYVLFGRFWPQYNKKNCRYKVDMRMWNCYKRLLQMIIIRSLCI